MSVFWFVLNDWLLRAGLTIKLGSFICWYFDGFYYAGARLNHAVFKADDFKALLAVVLPSAVLPDGRDSSGVLN